jgi:hypothetical protein
MRRHQIAKLLKWNSIIGVCLLLASVANPAWAGNEAEASKQLVGIWGKSRTDKESGDTEITLIKFNADGTYSTHLKSKLFGEIKKTASGRYVVTDAVKDTFTLKIEVLDGGPDLDESDRVIKIKVRMLNAKTLQSEDGQVVRRLK